MPRLPFVGRLYWRILPVVLILAATAFWIAARFFGYTMTNADYPGSLISAVIFSYLLHLWLLPAEAYDEYDEGYDDLEDDDTSEGEGEASPANPPDSPSARS